VSDAVRTALRGVGQTLMTLGVVVLLFCVYELYVTGSSPPGSRPASATTCARRGPSRRPARGVAAAGQPATVPVSLDLGQGFAVLHIPSLADYDPWVVVEGTSVADLKNGRATSPARRCPARSATWWCRAPHHVRRAVRAADELTAGLAGRARDAGRLVHLHRAGQDDRAPTATEVTLPVPGDPTAKPVERLLTLTTCHPKYSAKQRLIVRAELTAASSKSDGLPDALRGLTCTPGSGAPCRAGCPASCSARCCCSPPRSRCCSRRVPGGRAAAAVQRRHGRAGPSAPPG
jgi:sortase A